MGGDVGKEELYSGRAVAQLVFGEVFVKASVSRGKGAGTSLRNGDLDAAHAFGQ